MAEQRPFLDPNVESAFSSYNEKERLKLLQLRELIFQVAENTDGVGSLLETLKWNQPSYLTPETKSGSTIRLGIPKSKGADTSNVALYAHCQTSIVSEFKDMFPSDFIFEGNRAIYLNIVDNLPLDKLELLIRRALTYHL